MFVSSTLQKSLTTLQFWMMLRKVSVVQSQITSNQEKRKIGQNIIVEIT